MFYIVKIIIIFKDDSKYVKYFEFRNLEQAKYFINNYCDKSKYAEYFKDEVHISRKSVTKSY